MSFAKMQKMTVECGSALLICYQQQGISYMRNIRANGTGKSIEVRIIIEAIISERNCTNDIIKGYHIKLFREVRINNDNVCYINNAWMIYSCVQPY